MHVLPVATSLIVAGDDVAEILLSAWTPEDGDILVVSSKAVATAEGAAVPAAGDAGFRDAIEKETRRLDGRILEDGPAAMLTRVRPPGFPRGALFVPNAGMDRSNIKEGSAIGWPHNPVASAVRIRRAIEEQSGKAIAVIISDSCCRPGRLGVTALALACSGINPLLSQVGRADLFGRPLTVTQEAVADQLATAANIVMGNADQRRPAAVIRDHGFTLGSYDGWVPGIEPREDLFRALFADDLS